MCIEQELKVNRSDVIKIEKKRRNPRGKFIGHMRSEPPTHFSVSCRTIN